MIGLPEILATPWGPYLLVVLAAVATDVWRFAGFGLARRIDVGGELFAWVRFVATALVAALVARLMLVPAGALAGVPLTGRIAAVAAGFAAYRLGRRSLALGIIVGELVLVSIDALLG